MNELYLPFALATLVLAASLLSVRFALSVAILEIALGVLGGNLLHMHTTSWIDFLAGFGSVRSKSPAVSSYTTKVWNPSD